MKTYHTDAYFHIGAQHLRSGLPCEDYALAERGDGAAYAIVSDGCSSGGRTDVGARVLAHMTARSIRHVVEHVRIVADHEIHDLIRTRASVLLETGRDMLALNESDLLATSLVAFVHRTTGYVLVEGDGVVAFVYADGSMRLSSYAWDDNMPYYPSYVQGRQDSFIAAHGGDLDAVRLREDRVLVRGEQLETCAFKYTVREGMHGVQIPLKEDDLERLSAIGVFSDGVTQIAGVSWVDAVRQFLAFRSPEGAFVKRRMIRQLKAYDHLGAVPQDDIAGAVIQCV